MLRRSMILLLLLAPAVARADASQPAAIPSDAARALGLRSDSLLAVETRVRWAAVSPESALAKARRAGQPAFLDFYATWCVPCRWMDRAVYSDPLLSEAAEGVAMIRVDVDQLAGKALAARMSVQQYPTLIYVSPEGKETLRWVGPLNLRDTRLNLAQAVVPATRRADVVAACKRRPADAVTQASGILFYAYRGEVENARALAKAFDVAALGTPPATRAPVALALGKAEEFAGRDERAIDAYRRVIDLDPDGVWAWRAWLGLSACLERKGDHDEALAAARQAASRGPRTPALDARVTRLALGLPRPISPPGVDDGAAEAH